MGNNKQTARPLILLSFPVLVGLLVGGCHADRALEREPSKERKVKCEGRKYFINKICEDELKYLDWARDYPDYPRIQDLTTEVLRKVTRETKDVDKAAALFYQRVISEPQNLKFIEYLDKKQNVLEKKVPDYSGRKILFAVAPGMFYKDNPNVGADGRSVRKLATEIGLLEDVIPVLQTGTIEENGGIICDYVEKRTDVKGIILASASKGSSDIKKALHLCGSKPFFSKVRGWFNLGGINKGTRVVTEMNDTCRYRMEARSYFCWYGYNYDGILSIRYGPDSPMNFPLELPPSMLVINVIPVPMFRFVTPRARPFYEYLIYYGPNDGMSLLGDVYIPGDNVITYASWRNDHYFRFPVYKYRMMAVIIYMLEHQF